MYRRFNRVLLGLGLVGLGGMLALALWLEPVQGDLTRLGFYAENDFGWNGLEVVFDPPLALPGRLDGRYDVVVLGDSFSRPDVPGASWADHLAAATGLRVGVFHLRETGIEALLASGVMHGETPRLFVLEVVERMLRGTLDRDGVCEAPPVQAGRALPAIVAVAPRMRRRARDFGLSFARVSYLFEFVQVNMRRALTGKDGTKVRALPLTTPGLFTSRRDDVLLAYGQDYDRAGWDAAAWGRMLCRAGTIQAAVARAGATRFLLLVAPDKTTAYARQLAARDRPAEAMPRLAVAPGLALVRADLALRAAIDAGVKDVYLPNDTHWGSAGAAIVAREVMRAASTDDE